MPSSLEEAQPLLLPDRSSEAKGRARGTIMTSFLGLFSTMAGAGILALPSTLHHLGVVPGLALLTSMALLTWTSLKYLCICADVTSVYSYEDLTLRLFGPKLIWSTRLMTLLLLFGACVMYMVIAMDLIAPLIPTSRFITSLGFTTLVIPLCLPDSIYALRYTNALVMLCLVYITVSVGIRALDPDFIPIPRVPEEESPGNWLTRCSVALPIQGLSFGCQLNGIRAYGELSGPPSNMRLVNFLVVALGLGFYAAFALLGFVCFDGHPPEDVLTGFRRDDSLINGARLALASCMLFKTPVTFQPFREILEQLRFSRAEASHGGFRLWTTCVFMVLACVLANAASSISVVMDVMGSTAGLFLAFSVPGLFLWEVSAGYLHGVSLVRLKRPALCLMILGAGCTLLSMESLVMLLV